MMNDVDGRNSVSGTYHEHNAILQLLHGVFNSSFRYTSINITRAMLMEFACIFWKLFEIL